MFLQEYPSSERTAFAELHGSYHRMETIHHNLNHDVIAASAAAAIVWRSHYYPLEAAIVSCVCLSLTAVTTTRPCLDCLPTACAAPASNKKLINCHKSVFKLKWTENTLNSHINIST